MFSPYFLHTVFANFLTFDLYPNSSFVIKQNCFVFFFFLQPLVIEKFNVMSWFFTCSQQIWPSLTRRIECRLSFISAGIRCYTTCEVLSRLSPGHPDRPRQRRPVPVSGPAPAGQLHCRLHREENPSGLQAAAGKAAPAGLVLGDFWLCVAGSQRS